MKGVHMLSKNVDLNNTVILVTGAAGFVGANLVMSLLSKAEGTQIIGIDSVNDYYDVALKDYRLQQIDEMSKGNKNTWIFKKGNLADKAFIDDIFATYKPRVVVNLAAQAGVRYSIENPYAYIESNIDGFLNILEGCRNSKVSHLIYASSSSVYGLNGNVPFSEKDSIAHPVSLYAASKKADELMAHAYSHLYNIPTTGLRFFTVYGPWGRPDMSPFLFADAILHHRAIKVFNNGNMFRDFTYIDDIIEGIIRVMQHVPIGNKNWKPENPSPDSSSAPYKIYNIGNSRPVKLMDFIQAIENAIGREAEKIYLPMQPGDVYQTYADITSLEHDTGFKPDTSLLEGVRKTIDWYCDFYKLDSK